MKSVVVIRDRGQLTIPDSIRKMVNWVTPMSAVSITVVKPDEIVIRPQNQMVDKDKIWELIRQSRAIKARKNISALEAIEQDRLSH